MDQRIYHGSFKNTEIAQAIIAHFNQGALRVQQIGSGDYITVQIATSANARAGGNTALSISLQNVEDGVSVQVGQQVWLGIAANLGVSALFAIQNPLSLIGRLGDIAQDIEGLQLSDEVWQVIDQTARAIGSGYELSDRLRKYVCEYCQTPNPPGQSLCIACGAPLGEIQPHTCPNCGYVITTNESVCPNCHKQIEQ